MMLAPLIERTPLCVVQQISALKVGGRVPCRAYYTHDQQLLHWAYDTMPHERFWKDVAPLSCTLVQPEKFKWLASLEDAPRWMRPIAAFLKGEGDINMLRGNRDRDIMAVIGCYGDVEVYNAARARVMHMDTDLALSALGNAIDAGKIGMVRHICKDSTVLLGSCKEYCTTGIIIRAERHSADMLRAIFDAIWTHDPEMMLKSLANNPDAVRLVLSWVPAEERRGYILDVIGGRHGRNFAELMVGELAACSVRENI